MSASERMLTLMRFLVGMSGRPNLVTRDYASRNGREFLEAAWCDMTITYAARRSGNAAAVLPEGDRAYTVWHAADGRDRGLWFAGTAANLRDRALPGALVFFDWGGTDVLGRVDHVGIVEVNLGDGRVQTIEGNTADACKRRVRGPSVIAGFWNPAYDKSPAVARPKSRTWTEELVDTLPLLRIGAEGTAVKRMFYLIVSHGFPLDSKILDDTVMSEPVVKQLKALQKAEGLREDGECGPKTWAALIAP